MPKNCEFSKIYSQQFHLKLQDLESENLDVQPKCDRQSPNKEAIKQDCRCNNIDLLAHNLNQTNCSCSLEFYKWSLSTFQPILVFKFEK